MVVDRLLLRSISCIIVTMSLMMTGGCGKSDSVAENAPPSKSTATRNKVEPTANTNTNAPAEDRSPAEVPVVNTSPPTESAGESSPARTTSPPVHNNNPSTTKKNRNPNKKAPGIRGLGNVPGEVAAKEPAPAPTLPAPATPSGKIGTKAGDLIPEINGKDVDGVEFSLSDYEGKVVMLDFWGDW